MLKDKHFIRHLFFQLSAAVLFMWAVLHILDHVATSRILWAAGASSLASTTYIVFCLPRSASAAFSRLFPAYLVAILIGLLMRYLVTQVCFFLPYCKIGIPYMTVFEIAAAFSVGLSLLVMILLSIQHPPAAGLSVVMVLDVHNFPVVMTILSASLLLGLIRTFFYRYLHDLA